MSKLTPMMQQYQSLKAQHPDAILFFRLGDFYEMFGKDAQEASKILDITLTARNKTSNPVPMCGVPHHAAEAYIAKLTEAGKKVALCEQVSDPSLPGIVKRKVVRVVTPGTTFNDQLLDQKSNHHIAALFPQKDYFGLAYADLTTGEFFATELQGEESLKTELLRIRPAELVLLREHHEDPDLRVQVATLNPGALSPTELYEEAGTFLKKQFKVTTLEGFGLGSTPFATQAAALLLNYLLDTQQNELKHLHRIRVVHQDEGMRLDESTIQNLELFKTLRSGEEKGTLLSVLDRTETPMGGRCLRRWLLKPLLNARDIEARHKAVAELIAKDELHFRLQDLLQSIRDMERLLARLSTGSGNARDLLALAESLNLVPELIRLQKQSTAPLLLNIFKRLHALDAVEPILRAISEDAPIKLQEGGLIQAGYSPKLDQLRELSKNAKTALKDIEQSEQEKTGISSLKVRYNKVFGYYIEVTKSNLDKVPDHYVRKQTLANAERFLTPELKDYEEQVLNADEQAGALEYEIFIDLRDKLLKHISEIKENAQAVAQLDVLLSFAKLAMAQNYVQPNLSQGRQLQIEEGRHPVVEQISFEQHFIPNDAHFAEDEVELQLITGPNMSGKSTYLRQVALIALMNQMGSFVPATYAALPVFDQIFTRVGASDNLVKGQSTFMVEMQEAAYILNHATDKSLIIFDEVGRGTSTYDGLSLAWSMVEFVHDQLRSFTLFATHYHELIELTERLKYAKNYQVAVHETQAGVHFLHKIKEGGAPRSYGIEVAKLAGMPMEVVSRAQGILKDLESEKNAHPKPVEENQTSLFDQSYLSQREPGKLTHPALERLKGISPNEMTPLDALNLLDELNALAKQKRE